MRFDQAPRIAAGEIWLAEQLPGAPLCRLDHDAVSEANVVIYDRSLAPLVAEILPLGSYAEPASGNAIPSPRALEFAAQGWSVLHLTAARWEWRAGFVASLPVRAIVKTVGGYRQVDGDLHELPPLAEDELLTLVFGPTGAEAAVTTHLFTANGLAG